MNTVSRGRVRDPLSCVSICVRILRFRRNVRVVRRIGVDFGVGAATVS